MHFLVEPDTLARLFDRRVFVARSQSRQILAFLVASPAPGRFYNFEGLDTFKAKFQPEHWEPVYAIVNRPRFSPAALYAITAAFSDGSPVETIARALWRAARTESRWIRRRLLHR